MRLCDAPGKHTWYTAVKSKNATGARYEHEAETENSTPRTGDDLLSISTDHLQIDHLSVPHLPL